VPPWPSLLLEQAKEALGLSAPAAPDAAAPASAPADTAPSTFVEVKVKDMVLSKAMAIETSTPAPVDWSQDPGGTPAPATCTDTPDWVNGKTNVPANQLEHVLMAEANAIFGGYELKLWKPEGGFTCDYYGFSGVCIDMNALHWDVEARGDPQLLRDLKIEQEATGFAPRSCILQWDEMIGSEFKTPETNCCICGKGQAAPRCTDAEAKLHLTHQVRLMEDLHKLYGGGSLEQLALDGNPNSYFNKDGTPRSGYLVELEDKGELPPVQVTEALTHQDLHSSSPQRGTYLYRPPNGCGGVALWALFAVLLS
jgi:hypothetical protein